MDDEIYKIENGMVFPFYILPIVAVFHLTFFNES